MKKLFFFSALFFSAHLYAQVNRIDHFFVSSPNAEKLFKFFKEDLQLPVSWNFKSYGSFASGAVTLGNVAFEFVLFDSLTETKFDAIALEPSKPVEECIPLLDASQVAHDSIEYNTYTKKDGSIGGWSTMTLKNLLPDEAGLFICDYKEKENVIKAVRRDSAALKDQKGGALGIVSLKEIVVKAPAQKNYRTQLVKLAGISNNKPDVFSFSAGPSIRLINSTAAGIEKIVIRVSSLANTTAYLKLHGLLGNSTKGSVFINPIAIEGLLIEFMER